MAECLVCVFCMLLILVLGLLGPPGNKLLQLIILWKYRRVESLN